MSRRAVLTAMITLVAVAAGCTAVEWRGGTSAGAWGDCAAEARQTNPDLPATLRIECRTIQVPRDWSSATGGRAFDLALMRVRPARQRDAIGSIVLNPGGPGASGIDYLAYAAPRLSGLLASFDLIGFDPRGVARSSPLKCIPDADLDASFGAEPDPRDDASFQEAVDLHRRIAERCGGAGGDELHLYSTEQAARDLDAIRQALGEAKLNYLGYSYGTLLGAVYAQLFPGNIRAMVLDGAVDPRQDPIAGSEGQAKGFERALANFAAWCSEHPSSCAIAPDARAEILAAIDSARAGPVRGAGGRAATVGWVFYAVVAALYDPQAWPVLGGAIARLRAGEPGLVFLLADYYAERDPQGHYSNLFDANTAVNCTDSDEYPTVDEIRTLQARWRSTYPIFGAPLAVSLLSCAFWPAKKDPYPVGPAPGAPPIVVVGTLGDPATPYESTAGLAAMLGTGTVVTWQGEGHGAYPKSGCVRGLVEAYFIELAVPAKDATCPA